MSELDNRAIGWDEDIVADEQEFKVLADGDYDFKVVSFERSQYSGSDKLPPCMKISVTYDCTDGINTGRIIENFYLAKSNEWRIGSFLCAVGLKAKGEPTKPSRMQQSVGLTGRCKIITRKWTVNDGQEKTSNTIKDFYAKTVAPMSGFTPVQETPPAQFAAPQQMYQQPQQPMYQQQSFAAPNPGMWQGR